MPLKKTCAPEVRARCFLHQISGAMTQGSVPKTDPRVSSLQLIQTAKAALSIAWKIGSSQLILHVSSCF